MTVNGQRVDLEIQVRDEGDYPERTLYYWAREYSGALGEGRDYIELPRVVLISIMDFILFGCDEYHSEYRPLEVTRHTQLTDRMSLHYYELPKLPDAVSKNDELLQWLLLFKADTEEELGRIEAMGVPVMEKAINAYRSITVSPEFKEAERQRSIARHNEVAALRHEREVGARDERVKWEGIVSQKNAALMQKDTALMQKDTVIAEKDAFIKELLSQLGENK